MAKGSDKVFTACVFFFFFKWTDQLARTSYTLLGRGQCTVAGRTETTMDERSLKKAQSTVMIMIIRVGKAILIRLTSRSDDSVTVYGTCQFMLEEDLGE